MDEPTIRTFWNSHPCGESFLGGAESYRQDYEAFFNEYDQSRYSTEAHILDCLDQIDFRASVYWKSDLARAQTPSSSSSEARSGPVWI